MNYSFCVCLCVLTLSSASGQQPIQPLATADEIDLFHSLLISIADPSIDPKMAKQNEIHMVLQYGLNEQEAAAFHSVGQWFASAMNTFRAKRRTILAGKTIPSSADELALAAVSEELEQGIASVTNQLLNSLRPGKAALLRSHSQFVGPATAAARAQILASQKDIKGGN